MYSETIGTKVKIYNMSMPEPDQQVENFKYVEVEPNIIQVFCDEMLTLYHKPL